MSITFIVPSIGRPTLQRTLASIECRPDDEILLVGQHQYADLPCLRYVYCTPGHDWGATERNVATPYARGDYIAHIDDDDWYATGTRALMEDAIHATPGRPVLFRMQFPNGLTLWRERAIRCGNVGTPMILMPNRPERFGSWGSFVGGDCAFLESCTWRPEEYVWRRETIALLGHNV